MRAPFVHVVERIRVEAGDLLPGLVDFGILTTGTYV
jgi:hypothetical protein